MDIDKLLESGAFSADSIPQLEKHVKDQSTGSVPYHYAANRTLAKLYQFFPDCNNDSMLASILALALLQFPQTDIVALLCLIPEKSQESEPMATVIRCFQLLDACQFKEFWNIYKSAESNSELKTLFQPDQIRKGIIQVLAFTYRAAPLPIVLDALHVEKLNMTTYSQVESVSETEVTFIPTLDNTKRTRVFQEGLPFSAISSFVSASSQ